MNPSEIAKTVWTFVQSGGRVLWGYLKKHPGHLLTAAVVVIAVNQLVVYLNESADREITVYVGPPGSSSYRMSDRIAEAIRGISPAPGFHYRAVVEPTQGFVDVEQRLCDDLHGRSIGMTVDGVHQPAELRTLLPLDWDYLHVLARVGFLEEIRGSNGGAWATKFSDIVSDLKYDRVFAGPQDSGTRKFASQLFVKHLRKLEDYLAPAITDWQQAIVALRKDRIDLAFYSGPLGASTVQDVAKDGSAVLLSLTDLRSSLVREQEHSMIEVAIPKHSYRASPLLELKAAPPMPGDAATTANSQVAPLYFCGREVPTVAARRLVVTSIHMSDRDAFLISGALKEKLVEHKDISPNTWQRKSPDAPVGTPNSEFGVQVHPGAALQRDRQSWKSWWNPSTWDSTSRSVALGLFTLLATSLLQSVVQWMQRGPSQPVAAPVPAADVVKQPEPPAEQPSPADAVPSAYESLRAECESRLHELERLPESISANEYREKSQIVSGLRDRILSRLRDGHISEKESEVLFQAHRNLRVELAALKPSRQAARST